MPRAYFIPSVFTVGNLFFGFCALVQAAEGNFIRSAWFIIIAVLFDGMDGKIARWMHTESIFGFHLDSLADLVSVGVAPAMLLCRAPLNDLGFPGVCIGFLYVMAGAYRLARFNVIRAGDRSRGYAGLPTPVAGLLIASFFLFDSYTTLSAGRTGTWVLLTLSCSVLMISAVPFAWPRLAFKDRRSLLKSAGILGIVLVMALFPRQALFPVFLYYAFLGIGRWFLAVLKGRARWKSFFLPEVRG